MNKLAGFYELRASQLPTIKWEKYDSDTQFDEKLLWTIRSAVFIGDDFNLPRAVGVNSYEAKKKASEIKKVIGDNGIVIYYPYFIAQKSGTLNVFNDKLIIEAVKQDLWNLVTYSDRNVTIIIDDKETQIYGQEDFISEKEIEEFKKYANIVKRMYRKEFLQGKDLLLEWSYAYDTDVNETRIGDRYLVFYEVRTT